MVDTKQNSKRRSRGAQRARRQHSLALKRRLVEQSLVPGVSVARIALENGLNTNLLFKWRRQHLRGVSATTAKLLPVTVSGPALEAIGSSVSSPPAKVVATSGVIEVELPAGRIRIRGTLVDTAALRVVLETLAPRA